MNTTCQHVVVSVGTDYVCIAPANHGGEHVYVDAMGLVGVVNGHPIYSPHFQHSR